ncbi:uncharacterized protein LOC131623288 [Vicia villosa]|uniref:uncharacterized protein LOC131623288 n=1 Tax=Vicia villosa TaxID=3911 RepID=UPI00273C681B|nr:uncharacterized protein LOC131623288 [Vicia villosa]
MIVDHVVSHFTNIFGNNNAVYDNSLIEEAIHPFIHESTNNLLTLLPSRIETENVVFSLNKYGTPGPGGFGAFFFQTYWEIIKEDVFNAVLEFFTISIIMPDKNANTVILIPKTPNANTINNFRPIAMTNFKFKILSKILADMLALIMPNTVSKEQKCFIKGRHFRDCVCLTSEAINLSHNKSFGGNLALKIDIAKAFDTVD